MAMSDSDDRLIEDIRAALDADLDHVEPQTAVRLRAARMRALERAERPARDWTRFAPAGAFASACIVALVFMTARPDTPPIGMPEFEMLASGEDLELIEDLDFYEWLDSQDHAG